MRNHPSVLSRTIRLAMLTVGFVAASCGGSSGSVDVAEQSDSQVEAAPSIADATVTETRPASPEAAATNEPTSATATPIPDPTVVPEPTATVVPAPSRTTIDELLATDAPLSLAHAGGDQDAPHSTMFAFKEAAAAGVDMLEIDVQLTSDGELIVHHDATVDGTTNGTGLALDFTLAEIQSLDNAYWFAQQCWPCRDFDDEAYLYRGVRTGDTPPPDGYTAEDFRIITMRELVEQFPEMPFDIEIKGELPEASAVVQALAREIAAMDLTESVVVVSFDDEVVAEFEVAAPTVETSPGTDELAFWVLADVAIEGNRIVQVPPFFDGLEVLTDEFIARAGEAGLEVWAWPNDASTQENIEFYRELIALGVDGIIAGRPAAMEMARS